MCCTRSPARDQPRDGVRQSTTKSRQKEASERFRDRERRENLYAKVLSRPPCSPAVSYLSSLPGWFTIGADSSRRPGYDFHTGPRLGTHGFKQRVDRAWDLSPPLQNQFYAPAAATWPTLLEASAVRGPFFRQEPAPAPLDGKTVRNLHLKHTRLCGCVAARVLR